MSFSSSPLFFHEVYFKAGLKYSVLKMNRFLRGIVSLPLAGSLLLASWFYARPLSCNDVVSCPFPIVARGLPLAWIVDWTIGWRVESASLLIDFVLFLALALATLQFLEHRKIVSAIEQEKSQWH